MEIFGIDLQSLIHLIFYVIPLELFKNVFRRKKRFETNVVLDGKLAVITGANAGIGKETALRLTLRGAKVIIGCRDVGKGKEAIEDIQYSNPLADISVIELDLSSLKSVRRFAEEVSQTHNNIDLLINNAGVMLCPEWRTADGFEMQFGTNHLGHFLLTLSLMPLLKKSMKARVVTISSSAHMMGKIHLDNINLDNSYGPQKAYNQSKLANVLFSRELAKRLGPESRVTTYCLNPGIIRTQLFRHVTMSNAPLWESLQSLMMIDPELGAQTTLYCALEPSLERDSGFYYDDCKKVNEKCMVWRARDNETARLLWDLSSALVDLEEHLKL